MTLAPKPGKYIIGDVNQAGEFVGHTHELVIGEHPMDVDPVDESMSQLGGEFPRGTSSTYFNGYHHAHSVDADPNVDETLIVGPSNESRTPHTHTAIRKVET